MREVIISKKQIRPGLFLFLLALECMESNMIWKLEEELTFRNCLFYFFFTYIWKFWKVVSNTHVSSQLVYNRNTDLVKLFSLPRAILALVHSNLLVYVYRCTLYLSIHTQRVTHIRHHKSEPYFGVSNTFFFTYTWPQKYSSLS